MTKGNRTKLLFLVFFHLRTQREKKIDNLQLIFDQSNSASTTYNRRERERERGLKREKECETRVGAERPRGSQSHLQILIGRPSLSPPPPPSLPLSVSRVSRPFV